MKKEYFICAQCGYIHGDCTPSDLEEKKEGKCFLCDYESKYLYHASAYGIKEIPCRKEV